MRSRGVVSLMLVAVVLSWTGRSSAQPAVYPVVWPKAGGGTLVAVPVAEANVQIYHLVGAPHLAAFDTPFPLTPETTIHQAPADQPIILQAPVPPTAPDADEDHFYILLSNRRLVISMADDERYQFGTPDRIFFMPAMSGSFRGQTFYAEANGGDPEERIRVYNLSGSSSDVELFAWSGTAWTAQDSATVPPSDAVVFQPTVPMTAYKVTSTEEVVAIVGYLGDNASAPAVDINTGMIVGTDLFGYGRAWHLRAIEPLGYTVYYMPENDMGTWSVESTGSLGADEAAGAALTVGTPSYIHIQVQPGVGWGIFGTESLLDFTEWNGYFIPDQSSSGCLIGTRYFTNSSARTITMLPNPQTTVNIYDEQTSMLVDSYTSVGKWEFHNFFHPDRVRVEFEDGPGGVLLVGTLNSGDCDETTYPASCGILEGGYSLPSITGFKCRDDVSVTLQNCEILPPDSCEPGPLILDAAVWPEAGVDAAVEDDAEIWPDAGGDSNGNSGCNCQAAGAGSESFLLWLIWGLLLGRARKRQRCADRDRLETQAKQ